VDLASSNLAAITSCCDTLRDAALYDPVTLATAPTVLILVALLACQLPSRRALRIDPAVALRHE